jgi:hypothetical protein
VFTLHNNQNAEFSTVLHQCHHCKKYAQLPTATQRIARSAASLDRQPAMSEKRVTAARLMDALGKIVAPRQAITVPGASTLPDR